MAERVSSPRFVGRDHELRAALGHLRDIGGSGSTILLLAGEAGMGKTRFLGELRAGLDRTTTADRPVLVVHAAGLELAAGAIPYAPIIELLDGLASSLSPPGADQARGLAREFGGRGGPAGSDDEPDSRAEEAERAARFGRLCDLFAEAAVERDLVIVVDDLHWADLSTLDALRYLIHRSADRRIAFVLAYRSDALHRRHPLRAWLNAIGRALAVQRIELGRLPDTAIEEQVEAIVGRTPGRDVLARLLDAAEGNPFYAEEIVAHLDDAAVPPTIRDAMLDRVDGLEPTTLEMIRLASVVGRDWDEALLQAIAGSGLSDVRGAMREVAAAGIVEPAVDGLHYRFRHALLREAVYDDLMPADRVDAHRRVADALRASPDLAAGGPAAAAAELAHHLDAGRRPVEAFRGFVAAARTAEAASAWAEGRRAYERALELAEDPAVAQHIDETIDRYDLYRDAAWSMFLTGRPEHAVAMLRRALEVARGRADGTATMRALSDLSYAAVEAGDWAEARAAVADAGAAQPEEPTMERLIAMEMHGGLAMQTSHNLEAIRTLEPLESVAAAVGTDEARRRLTHGLAIRAASQIALGRASDAVRDLDRAAELIDRRTDPDTVGTVAINRVAVLTQMGRWTEGLATAEDALGSARRLGLEGSWQPWLAPLAGLCCLWLGRLDEAERYLARGTFEELFPMARPAMFGEAQARQLAALRGDPAAPAAAARRADELGTRVVPDLVALFRLVAAEGWTWHDRTDPAMDQVRRGLSALEGTDEGPIFALLLAAGIRAGADRAARERARRLPEDATVAETDRWWTHLRSIADGSFAEGAASGPLPVLLARLTEPEVERAHAQTDPGRWRDAAEHAAASGIPIPAAYAWYREAEAHLVLGDRDASGRALQVARESLAAIRPTRMHTAIDDLARRARLPVGDVRDLRPTVDATSPDDRPWGLSDREREVLVLIADGRTNREIGAALFISEKTASVHVTHILDKMGVDSRVEAALQAARAGIGRSSAAPADDDTASLDR